MLTDAEIKAVWGAVNDWPYGSIIRLLLATGRRRAEVGGMRWAELDLENRLWRLPKERTKSQRDHLVPLNSLAMEILTACPRMEGRDGVFSTRRTKGEWAVFAGWSVAKYRLDARCNVQGWRLHDLRRTVATGMQAAGVMPHVVAAVLNHSQAGLFGVTAIYLRDRQEEAKRAALELWCGRFVDEGSERRVSLRSYSFSALGWWGQARGQA